MVYCSGWSVFLVVLLQKTLINTGLDTIIVAGIIHLTDYQDSVLRFDEIAYLFSMSFDCMWKVTSAEDALTSIYCFT